MKLVPQKIMCAKFSVIIERPNRGGADTFFLKALDEDGNQYGFDCDDPLDASQRALVKELLEKVGAGWPNAGWSFHAHGQIIVADPHPKPVSPPERINLNTANKTTLRKLPGVGPSTAAKIMEGRVWKKLEDLILKIDILDEEWLALIKDMVTLGLPPENWST